MGNPSTEQKIPNYWRDNQAITRIEKDLPQTILL
jgi:hypothetical protein